MCWLKVRGWTKRKEAKYKFLFLFLTSRRKLLYKKKYKEEDEENDDKERCFLAEKKEDLYLPSSYFLPFFIIISLISSLVLL